MNRLTNEQLAEIRKRAEAAKEVPFYTWEASELIEQDVPKLLAEIDELLARIKDMDKYIDYISDELRKENL